MAKPLAPDRAKNLSLLAQIAIADADLPAFAARLQADMDFLGQLDQVDITDVEPMTMTEITPLPLRKDEVTEGEDAEAILANAPDAREGFFAVPKMVE